MLTQLLQWLKKFSNHSVDDQQNNSFRAAPELEVTQPPPELTNADLEFLYTQLLAGVQQGRGQQWAIEYLQRMEDRISVERWIDWLLIFAEKLLLSPRPNHQLATQMVQLGELGIGKVGELSYDIGIRLLTGELRDDEQESQESETITSTLPPLDSPGVELIRNLGELLWESDDLELTTTPATPPVEPAGEMLTEDGGKLTWEYSGEAEEPTTAPVATPTDEDVMDNFSQVSSESEDELLVRVDQSANLVQQLPGNLSPWRAIPAIIADQANVQAQDWFYQGLQQAKIGDLEGAIACYTQAIEMNPDAFEYWFNHALTLFHLQCFPEAIASYDEAIALKPHHYKSWYYRGGTLGELGRFAEAVASFDQAIAIQPQNPEAWSSRGLALIKLGEVEQAISSYDQALHLEPQDPTNWYYRGIALAVIQQYTEAIASYDQAIAIQPDFYEVWIDRGVVLFNLGNWSEAIASWDQALAAQPDLYLACYNRGIALDNLGQREEAIASYNQAVAIKPDFHLAWYNQAVALFYLTRYAEAIAAYDKALEIKPDYWEAWIGRGIAASNLVTPTNFSLSANIATQNPALQQGGYEGKLASLEEGVKHIRPDTHPEGWGKLHIAKGNTYYELGKKFPTSRIYWYQAIAEYHQALLTLTTADFAELHLEVLQSLIKTLLGTGEITQAQELQQQAADLLAQILTESTRGDDSKKQLALKFAGIGQLEVDLAVEYGDIVEAWEMAEQGKNSCLTWLLYDWHEKIYTHYYNSVQQLLNPHTAIIYWHISPVALHTFIIKHQAPSPILVFTPIQNVNQIDLQQNPQFVDELPLPEAVRRLIEFENWLEDWHQSYQAYLRQAQDQHSKSNHTWRVDMQARLFKLTDILQIPTITQELEDITQLILIPHRQLHLLPLHTLFNIASLSQPELPGNFIISYLPTVQKGLSVKAESTWTWADQQTLLSLESANSANYSLLKFTKFASDIISQMFNNSRCIQNDNVSKNEVENALFDQHYHIFHFAGSMVNNVHEPKKSALSLGNEVQITLAKICERNLNHYKLVTLASGDNETNKYEDIITEYVDLTTAFIARGVPYIVSSLWTVESSSSALVMIDFYRRLQLNQSPVTALAAATLWLKELTALDLTKWYEDLLNNLDPDQLKVKAYLATYLYRTSKMVPDKKLYSHPYYWAGYKITGINLTYELFI
ncbi:tetratricopeptide repeat protein [Chrysosporum bergii ANA360D]|uniref:Tetratricopeptide repeat protein n=1 Tax=Chrysosporum bergii ANA360D TaxID=617107 RepID=A0AA43GUP6_9CYAN|nr:tetratricopeptide repeat protein [Chrysosporum bergii]MDH6062031.1 tetratricopeptide repeat protein [Chrysosporum bergii ANA360D]